MKIVARLLLAFGIIGGGGATYAFRGHWLPTKAPTPSASDEDTHGPAEPGAPSQQVLLSEQGQKNLKLTAKALAPSTYWKTITVPGMVIDRPSHSDHGITIPATGSITRIHHVAGELVKPGDVLFTVKLLSESLQLSQQDLFKATQEYAFAQTQKKQLMIVGDDVPKATRMELDNRISRLEGSIRVARQELTNRGLSTAQIDEVSTGKFVTEMPIVVPERTHDHGETLYEIQEVKVELGQQAQAGQTLCLLANHALLAIEGRAFRDEAPLLEKALQEGWPVEVDFGEQPADWPVLPVAYPISHLANTIDPESRTFRFLMPLDNQAKRWERMGRTQIIWRFRPGQRVRLRVRVEEMKNIFVLPTEAVVRDGGEAYVFRQNGDTFDRKPVHVLHQDRLTTVLANDGSVPPGMFIVQRGATQLNRMVKSSSSTVPAGFHIHADGSVHMNHK